MRTNELLEVEKNNIDSIFLYKEGIFWRCYETSAWYFIKNIREYQVFKKFIKIVNQDIIYLGFPDSILEKIILKAEKKDYSIIKSETKIIITGIQQKNGFLKWKRSISLSKPKIKNVNNDCIKIIHKIKEFEIVNSTPVEAFNFLAEIQKQLLEL